jgi:site-specific DNA recombinase
MPRVGVYLRISEDKDGEQTATERQRLDCERFAANQGWEVADVFEDVDLSAFKRNVKRPEFERMLEAVKTKAIDGVLAWKIDRLTRRQRDLVRLDEACEDAGGFIVTLVDGIDTRTAAGRFTAELLTSMARMESENISVRGKRKALELAQAGRPTTGGTRMFGYSQDRMTIIEDEASVIRELVQRVKAGEALRGLCFDLQRRGAQTPTGGYWRQLPLKRLLTSAAISGQREHNGVLTAGCWPAIVTPDDLRSIRLILEDSRRNKRGPIARKYLLTGFLRCGNCGELLVARPRLDKSRRYVCSRQPGLSESKRCGKLARMAEPVEALVTEAVCIALDGVDLREHVMTPAHDDEDLHGLIRADEEALEELSADYYQAKVISRSEFFANRDALDARLRANRERLGKANGHGLLSSFVGAGEAVRRQWDERGLDWRRAVIAAVVDHIVIEPEVRGRNRFDATKVRIVWRY